MPNQRLGARPRIAHHQRRHHDKRHQHHIPEPVDPAVVHQQPEKQHHIGIPVDHRIEKRSKDRHLVVLARHPTVHHVEDAGAEDHHSRIEKHPPGIGCVGVAKQKRGHDVDHQADKSKNVRGNAGKRQAVHDVVKKPAAGAAESTGPGHSNLP